MLFFNADTLGAGREIVGGISAVYKSFITGLLKYRETLS